MIVMKEKVSQRDHENANILGGCGTSFFSFFFTVEENVLRAILTAVSNRGTFFVVDVFGGIEEV